MKGINGLLCDTAIRISERLPRGVLLEVEVMENPTSYILRFVRRDEKTGRWEQREIITGGMDQNRAAAVLAALDIVTMEIAG